MCRIFCLTSHDPAQRNAIISKIWNDMTSQSDGYGAAWFGLDGQIGFFKRSHPRIYGYDSPEGSPYVPPAFVKTKKGVGYQKPTFHESNDIPSDGGFLIIHGRNATSAVKVENTHPMLTPGAAMVHNGVVQSTKYENEIEGCSCDSELLLNAYISGGIDELEKEITGYYAFMCLQLDDSNEKTLHVLKDGKATLYCGLTPDRTFVFSTTEYMLKLANAEPMGEVQDNTAMIFTDKTTFTAGTFEPLLLTHFSKETKDKIDKAFDSGSTHGPSEDLEDIYDRGYGHNGRSSQFPARSTAIEPSEQIKRELAEIDRLEREAIDDKVFEVVGTNAS